MRRRHDRRVDARTPPRVDDRAVVGGLVGRAHGELVHVELAEHHRAVGPEIGGDGRFVARLEAVEDVAAGLGVDAFGAEQVLDAERNAFERAALALRELRVRRLRHVARLVRRHGDIGVEHGIGALDRREIGVGQFDRGESPWRAASSRASAIVSLVRSVMKQSSFRRSAKSRNPGSRAPRRRP